MRKSVLEVKVNQNTYLKSNTDMSRLNLKNIDIPNSLDANNN